MAQACFMLARLRACFMLEREGERERGMERERERESVCVRKRGIERDVLFLFLKGMRGALAPFSYLVHKYLFFCRFLNPGASTNPCS